MAKNKIERIDQEIAKTREKIAEQQEKLKDLETQKTEAENLEIVQMVRALRLTPEQLNPYQNPRCQKNGSSDNRLPSHRGFLPPSPSRHPRLRPCVRRSVFQGLPFRP